MACNLRRETPGRFITFISITSIFQNLFETLLEMIVKGFNIKLGQFISYVGNVILDESNNLIVALFFNH